MESLRDQLTTHKGTYALALYLNQPLHITVGALGTWAFPQGAYLYIGSAWGSGGLRARLARHIEGSQKRHWHVDYLRQFAQPVGFWVAPQQHLECTWADYAGRVPQAHIVVPRFGASDCTCATHLFLWEATTFKTLVLPDKYHFIEL